MEPPAPSGGGSTDVRKVAAYSRELNIRVHAICHSVKERARQTAMMFAEYLNPEKGISQDDNLLPLDDPGLWVMRIAGMQEDTMLVGHLPFMRKLSSMLLSGDRERVSIDFKMGGIVCLKRIDGAWAIAWMVTPELIR